VALFVEQIGCQMDAKEKLRQTWTSKRRKDEKTQGQDESFASLSFGAATLLDLEMLLTGKTTN